MDSSRRTLADNEGEGHRPAHGPAPRLGERPAAARSRRLSASSNWPSVAEALSIDRFAPTPDGWLRAQDAESSEMLRSVANDLGGLSELAEQWQGALVAAFTHFGWLSSAVRVFEMVAMPHNVGVDAVSGDAVFETLAITALLAGGTDVAPVRRVVPPDSAQHIPGLCIAVVKACSLIETHHVHGNTAEGVLGADAFSEIRAAQIHEGIMGRGPGHFLYPDVDMLRAFFAFDPDLDPMWAKGRELLPSTALRMSGYLSARAMQILAAIRSDATETTREMAKALARYSRRTGWGLEVPIAPTDEHVYVPPGTSEACLDELCLAGSTAAMAPTFTIAPEDFAVAEAQGGIPQADLRLYLDLFSTEPESWDRSSIVTRPLEARLQLRQRPVLRLSGSWCPVPLTNHVGRSLRRRLDDDLASDEVAGKRYIRLRTRFTETRSAEQMHALTQASQVVAPAYFELEDGHWAEIDALLISGPYLYLVEVKGQDFRPRAQAGSPAPLAGDLERIIRHANAQLRRAEGRLMRAGARVRDSKRRPIDLPPLEHLFSVNVTYERLVGVAPTVWRLEDQGLILPGGSALPWIISLPELAVVAEILTPPFELPAYLFWRSAVLGHRTLEAIEECDLLMAFLRDDGHGLARAIGGRPGQRGVLADQTQQLSDHFALKAIGEKSDPPRKVRKKADRAFLNALADANSPDRWTVAQLLFEGSREHLHALAMEWARPARKRPRRRPRDVVVIESEGVNFVVRRTSDVHRSAQEDKADGVGHRTPAIELLLGPSGSIAGINIRGTLPRPRRDRTGP